MKTEQRPVALSAPPTPVTVKLTPHGPSIRDAEGKLVAECYFEDDAALIARLLNSHADTLEALKTTETILAILLKDCPEANRCVGVDITLVLVRVAIAKAEGRA